MQRVRVLGLQLQYSPVTTLRFGQATGLMMLQRKREVSIYVNALHPSGWALNLLRRQVRS
jgi:hypothetical protein